MTDNSLFSENVVGCKFEDLAEHMRNDLLNVKLDFFEIINTPEVSVMSKFIQRRNAEKPCCNKR